MDSIEKFLEKAEVILRKIYGRKAIFIIGILILAVGITVARRPDALTNPQFWAEDGVLWYQEAYMADDFAKPFLTPRQSYFQTISRIGAALSMPFDIAAAPLIFNILAISITVLPALYFLSSRFEGLMPKISHRLFLSLAYLSIPGASEVHVSLTYAQWHLALLMILVIIAPASKNTGWKIFDSLALLISGLSGPFALIGWPIFLAYSYFKSATGKKVLMAALGLTFFVQLYSLLIMVEPVHIRSRAPLGASVMYLFKIVSGNVFLKGIISPDITGIIRSFGSWQSGLLPIATGIIGFIALAYAYLKSKIEMRLFIIFSFLVLAAGLYSPQVNLTKPQWNIMANGAGGRYYYLAIIAWIVTLSFLFVTETSKKLKILFSVLLACFIFIGIPNDFIVKKLKNYNFQKQAEEFKSLGVGESYTFKIPPRWDMPLTKK